MFSLSSDLRTFVKKMTGLVKAKAVSLNLFDVSKVSRIGRIGFEFH